MIHTVLPSPYASGDSSNNHMQHIGVSTGGGRHPSTRLFQRALQDEYRTAIAIISIHCNLLESRKRTAGLVQGPWICISLMTTHTPLPFSEAKILQRLNKLIKKQTPSKKAVFSLTKGMVFPDLHKVFCTTRGSLKIKIFKTDGKIVSWEAPEMPLTKHIVWIGKGWVSNALNDSIFPWDCSSTGGWKTNTHEWYSIMDYRMKPV